MASQNRELKKAGLKVTAPRLKILAMLSDASEQGDHLSAEDLYQRLRDTGLLVFVDYDGTYEVVTAL